MSEASLDPSQRGPDWTHISPVAGSLFHEKRQPKEARWSHLQANAKQPTIGKLIDDAMAAIEKAQPRPQGRSAQGLQPPGARQGDARRTDRPDLRHRHGRAGRQGQGHPRPRLRVFPRRLRRVGGQARRRVLYAALGRARAGRDAGALQGPRLRPVLRLGRHVRSVGEVRRKPRRTHRRHRHLRAGEQLHDVAARQDEPRGARHRRRHPLEQRGQLPQGRTARTCASTTSSPIRRSTFPTGAASGCARTRAGHTARRRSATPTTRGSNTSSGTSRRTARRAWCWPTARCRRRRSART